MLLVALYDIFVNVVLFSEEDVSFLLMSELTELWERVVVLHEVVLLLSKLMMVFPKDVTLLFEFLVTVCLLVLDLGQVILLLDLGVGYFVSDDFLCVLMESVGWLKRFSRITGSFS